MDFGAIFQIRNRKSWWMDVIFYFTISLLIAVVFCYLIFIVKNNIQRTQIKEEEDKIESVASGQQKSDENEVILYQKKIGDFVGLLKNHEFASHAFIFMEQHTLPDVWFERISIDEGNASLQLSGETDNMESLSRQVAVFEKNEYVKSIGLLNSSLGESAMVSFNLSLALDSKIFSYTSDAENQPDDEVIGQTQLLEPR